MKVYKIIKNHSIAKTINLIDKGFQILRPMTRKVHKDVKYLDGYLLISFQEQLLHPSSGGHTLLFAV